MNENIPSKISLVSDEVSNNTYHNWNDISSCSAYPIPLTKETHSTIYFVK
jgi:hypothetical protein